MAIKLEQPTFHDHEMWAVLIIARTYYFRQIWIFLSIFPWYNNHVFARFKEKGKPVEKRGRKAMGLRLLLRLPSCHNPFRKNRRLFPVVYGKEPHFILKGVFD
ncbi:hypothetical protein DESME_14165 [Desulfitobacterium metallireducens DSM 15288]|uniref:Uncharacterized protein n=1 Tax=Desulfitobacterium metallireducens DSM 15288 TaxID=871968 RepID=W0EHK9_9FIRM|nr:hypothetical protein DESME_14165 [Desulfitobacterium metallireducens DSM 15288]